MLNVAGRRKSKKKEQSFTSFFFVGLTNFSLFLIIPQLAIPIAVTLLPEYPLTASPTNFMTP